MEGSAVVRTAPSTPRRRFVKGKYSLHNKWMHSTKWTEYCDLDTGAKKSFFDIGRSSGSQAMMHAFSRPHRLPLHALIDKNIVDIIIGDIIFHPEDMYRINQARLLASFVPTLDSSEDAAYAGNVSCYSIIVGNTK